MEETFQDGLRMAVDHIQRQRVREELTKTSNDSDTLTAELIREMTAADCVACAEYLKDELQSRLDVPDSDIQVVKGAYNYECEPYPESYEMADKIGLVHHWVTVEHNDTTFVCDIAPATYNETMTVVETKNMPNRYVTFE